MFKAILSFVIMFLFFFVGIYSIYSMKKAEKVVVKKIAGYSVLCAAIAVGFLALIVKLF